VVTLNHRNHYARYEKAKQYDQIVQYYMEKDAYAEIISAGDASRITLSCRNL
jgi:hypothetical protein